MRSGTSCCVRNLIQPIRSTTQFWVVTRHQYGISALVSQTSFRGETSGGITKCRLFYQLKVHHTFVTFLNPPCTTAEREVSYFRIRCRTLKSKSWISRFLFRPWLQAMWESHFRKISLTFDSFSYLWYNCDDLKIHLISLRNLSPSWHPKLANHVTA